jgi:hypothetical protein
MTSKRTKRRSIRRASKTVRRGTRKSVRRQRGGKSSTNYNKNFYKTVLNQLNKKQKGG